MSPKAVSQAENCAENEDGGEQKSAPTSQTAVLGYN